MKKQLIVSDILILVGSIVVLVCFFLPWESDIMDLLYGPQAGLNFATVATSHTSGLPGLTYFIVPISALVCLALLGIHIFSQLEIKNRDLILLIITIIGILPFIQFIIELGTWTAQYTLRYGLYLTVIGLLLSLSGAVINVLKKR
jgi:hypothetical protein